MWNSAYWLVWVVVVLAWCGVSPDVFAASGRSQQQHIVFQGRVVWKGRRDPVEGAGVFLRELRTGAYTNEKGQFRLRVPAGSYTVVVKALGYLTLQQTLRLHQSWEGTLYLESDPKNPFQSTVRVKREKETPGQVSVSREEIRKLPGGLGNDSFRALQNLPGVARANGLSGALHVRGAAPADTGFYLDGHRIPLLYHFGAGPAVLNDRFIDQIDFYPGAAPAPFGRLTGGLISVSSRTSTAQQIHGEVFLDIVHAGLFLEIPLGKQWSITLAARRSYADALIPLITKDALIANYWDYQFKIVWQNREHLLSLFVFGSSDTVKYEGGEGVVFLGDDPLSLDIHFLRWILLYRFQKGIVRFQISVAGGFDQTATETPQQSGSLWTWPVEIRSELRLQLHSRFRLSVGLDGGWRRDNYSFKFPVSEFLGFPKPSSRLVTLTGQGEKDQWYPGAYLTAAWQPHKQVSLILGARGEWYAFQERVVWTIDPRVSLQWKIHKMWTILAAGGLYHQPPDLQQWSQEAGNPDLRLQAAVQSALGAEFQPIPELSIRAQFFYNHMFERVVGSGRAVEINGKLQRENYNNEGLGRAYGLEVLLRMRNWKGLSAWMSYTLSRAERGDINNGINSLYSYDQTHILNLILQYEIGWGWSVGLRFRLVSGRPFTPVVGARYDADTDRYTPIQGERDSERRPVFHQLDLRVDKLWTFNRWKLGLYLDIINVYNAQITENYRYQFDYAQRFPIPGIPIIPAFGIRGEF